MHILRGEGESIRLSISNNRFEINNLDDIDVWMNFLKESLENKEEIFKNFQTLII